MVNTRNGTTVAKSSSLALGYARFPIGAFVVREREEQATSAERETREGGEIETAFVHCEKNAVCSFLLKETTVPSSIVSKSHA